MSDHQIRLDDLEESRRKIVGAGIQQDAQTSVLTRLTFTKLNELLVKAGLPVITSQDVNGSFQEYQKLAEHGMVNRGEMERWFFGESTDSLFPPEPAKNTNDAPDGAVVFGGDYGEGTKE